MVDWEKTNHRQGSPRLLLATGQMRSRAKIWQSQSTLEGSLGLCKPHTPEIEFERGSPVKKMNVVYYQLCTEYGDFVWYSRAQSNKYTPVGRLDFRRYQPGSCQQWTQQRVAPSRHLLQSSFQQLHHSPWRVYFLPWKMEINIAKGTTDPGVDCFDQ